MPKRHGQNRSRAERLRGLLKIVAVDGDRWIRFDENTVAGLGFTAREQRQLVAAYNIRMVSQQGHVTDEKVTLENAERIFEAWRAERVAATRAMHQRDGPTEG